MLVETTSILAIDPRGVRRPETTHIKYAYRKSPTALQ
ncbi:hypothetical protein MALU111345_07550 [Marinicrinis lubricantis]